MLMLNIKRINVFAVLSFGFSALAACQPQAPSEIASTSSAVSQSAWTLKKHPPRNIYVVHGLVAKKCKDTPKAAECSEDRWLLGANLNRFFPFEPAPRFEETNAPGLWKLLWGVDGAISVHFQGKTRFYFSDTWGRFDLSRCAESTDNGSEGYCNDVVGIYSTDDNPADGLDIIVPTVKVGNKEHLSPLILPGVNQKGDPHLPHCKVNDPEDLGPCIGHFTTPTGVDVVKRQLTIALPGSPVRHTEVDMLVLMYGAAFNEWNLQKDAPKGSSWMFCSLDGKTFYNCLGSNKPFSRERFMRADPVYLSPTTLREICIHLETSGSILCKLPKQEPGKFRSGFLLYGGGPRYRCGSLHLAYVDSNTFETFYYHKDASGKESWKLDEADATPILEAKTNHCIANVNENNRFVGWKFNGPDSERTNLFSEFSVKLIPALMPKSSHLVMISHHQGHGTAYRHASILNPQKWSAPEDLRGVGYDAFIIETGQNAVSGGKLQLYYTIAGWLTDPWSYGVYTRPMKLKSTDDFPAWPPR